jgi:hypothetical protein
MVKAAPFWFLAPWALVPNSFCHPSPPVLFSLLLDFTQGVPSALLFWVRRPMLPVKFLSSCFAYVAIQNLVCRCDFVVLNFVRMLVGGSQSCF